MISLLTDERANCLVKVRGAASRMERSPENRKVKQIKGASVERKI
jgi:hypothetical protein